jgi:hypothetical protein
MVRVSAGPSTIQPFRPENPALVHSVGMDSIDCSMAILTTVAILPVYLAVVNIYGLKSFNPVGG